MKANVVFHADAPLQDLGGGVSRRVLAYTESLMIVEVHFAAGGVGSVPTCPPFATRRVVGDTVPPFALNVTVHGV